MELIIEPGRAEKNYWRDLWRYRELFYFLAWRDILVRYKQTVIGIAWAVIQPFLTTVVFTIVFSRIAKLPAPAGVPYFLLVMAAQLPWQFFSTSLSDSSNSLIGNANLISKIYFPRLIVPAGSVITSFVDFLITLGLMAVMMVWFHFLPDWRILLLPALRDSGLWRGLWRRPLALRVEREIPRLPLHHPLHRAIRVLSFRRSATAATGCRKSGTGTVLTSRRGCSTRSTRWSA